MKHSTLTCVEQHLGFIVLIVYRHPEGPEWDVYCRNVSKVNPSFSNTVHVKALKNFDLKWVEYSCWCSKWSFQVFYLETPCAPPRRVSWVSLQWPPLVVRGYCAIVGLKASVVLKVALLGELQLLNERLRKRVVYRRDIGAATVCTLDVWPFFSHLTKLLAPGFASMTACEGS